MAELFYAGSTSQSIDVFIQDSSSTTGAGLTGLVFNSSGLVAYYRKGVTGSATQITLATQTVGGAYSSGGFVEIDSTNMPGVYRLDLPNAMIDTAGFSTLYLRGATNMAPTVVRVDCRPLPSDLRQIGGSSVSTSSAQLGVNVVNWGGTATGSASVRSNLIEINGVSAPSSLGVLRVDVTQISGDQTAADNAEAFFDGTGYAGTNNVIPTVTTLTNLPTIPNNWLTAAGLATDAVTEIQSGLATSSALTTVETKIDTIDGIVDSILVDTNELQTDWANGGRLDLILDATATASAVSTVSTNLSALITTVGVDGAGLTEAGGTGDHLTAIPWNASWDAEVQSEVQDAIVVNGLDHLLAASVSGTDIVDNSIVARLASKSATADWDSYNNTTDSLEAIRDRGDAAWTTGSGGGGGGSTILAPVAGNSPDRVEETTLKAFVGETWSEQVGGLDANGDVIDFTALGDLEFVLENNLGTDVVVIANADITKAPTYFQVSIDDQYIGTVPTTMKWALRQVTNNKVVLYGPFVVQYAADN